MQNQATRRIYNGQRANISVTGNTSAPTLSLSPCDRRSRGDSGVLQSPMPPFIAVVLRHKLVRYFHEGNLARPRSFFLEYIAGSTGTQRHYTQPIRKLEPLRYPGRCTLRGTLGWKGLGGWYGACAVTALGIQHPFHHLLDCVGYFGRYSSSVLACRCQYHGQRHACETKDEPCECITC